MKNKNKHPASLPESKEVESVEQAAEKQFPFFDNDDQNGNYIVSSQRHGFYKGATWHASQFKTNAILINQEKVINIIEDTLNGAYPKLAEMLVIQIKAV